MTNLSINQKELPIELQLDAFTNLFAALRGETREDTILYLLAGSIRAAGKNTKSKEFKLANLNIITNGIYEYIHNMTHSFVDTEKELEVSISNSLPKVIFRGRNIRCIDDFNTAIADLPQVPPLTLTHIDNTNIDSIKAIFARYI